MIFQKLHDIGCIVCLNEYGIHSDADIHHILKNGKRIGDSHVIPLCPTHHRSGLNNPQVVSRHPWRKEFERRYGPEMELFEQVKDLIL